MDSLPTILIMRTLKRTLFHSQTTPMVEKMAMPVQAIQANMLPTLPKKKTIKVVPWASFEESLNDAIIPTARLVDLRM